MPRSLGEGRLQGVVGTDFLVGDLNDVRQVRELAEVWPAQILAGCVDRRCGAGGRADRSGYGCGASGSAVSRLLWPAGAQCGGVDVVEAHQTHAVAADIGKLQGYIVAERMLETEVPGIP